jgi:hypothetical protein
MDDAQPLAHERVAQIVEMFEAANLACEIVT